MNPRETISEGPGSNLSIAFTHLLSPLRYLSLSFDAYITHPLNLLGQIAAIWWSNIESAFNSIMEIIINGRPNVSRRQ